MLLFWSYTMLQEELDFNSNFPDSDEIGGN